MGADNLEAALSAAGFKVLAQCVCGTDKTLPGLLLERPTKLHADRQQGGDATTPTGVLYIKCQGDCCEGRPLELNASGGCIFSGNAFEAHAGRSYRKKWRETIRVLPQNISLKGWLASVGRADYGRDSPPHGNGAPDLSPRHADMMAAAAALAAAAAAADPPLPLPRAPGFQTPMTLSLPQLPVLVQAGARHGNGSTALHAHAAGSSGATLLQLALEQQRQEQASPALGAAGVAGLLQQLLQQGQPHAQQAQQQQTAASTDPILMQALGSLFGRPPSAPPPKPASPRLQQEAKQPQQAAAAGSAFRAAASTSDADLASVLAGVVRHLQSQQEQLASLSAQLQAAQRLITEMAGLLAATRTVVQEQAAGHQQLRGEVQAMRAAMDIFVELQQAAAAPKRDAAAGVGAAMAGAPAAAAGASASEAAGNQGQLRDSQQAAPAADLQPAVPSAQPQASMGKPPSAVPAVSAAAAGVRKSPDVAAGEQGSPGGSPNPKRPRTEAS